MPDNLHHKISDAYGNPRPTKILKPVHHLLSRNSRIQEDVVDQLFNSSEKRLARLLLLLTNYGKEGNPPIVPVTRKSGDACGNDRHHAIPGFRKSGFIAYNGKIEVHPSVLNSLLRDKPHIREDEPLVIETTRASGLYREPGKRGI